MALLPLRRCGCGAAAFKLRGSNTEVKLGGYVELDAVLSDRSAGVGSKADLEYEAGAVPVGPAADAHEQNQLKLHARESRFSLQTPTPSSWGDARTYPTRTGFACEIQTGERAAKSHPGGGAGTVLVLRVFQPL